VGQAYKQKEIHTHVRVESLTKSITRICTLVLPHARQRELGAAREQKSVLAPRGASRRDGTQSDSVGVVPTLDKEQPHEVAGGRAVVWVRWFG
jgi:hypothetical protein